jgi:hypothetical protein
MWFWLRRLGVGELKNKTNFSPARASLLGLSLAKSAISGSIGPEILNNEKLYIFNT